MDFAWSVAHSTSYTSNPRKKCPLYGFNRMGGQIPVKLIETLLSMVQPAAPLYGAANSKFGPLRMAHLK